ncbi:MAG TPA: VanZ family protein [Vicinamibacterales bacterium]|nr:VanZ family protein [Vicinamibacterales bacterium]
MRAFPLGLWAPVAAYMALLFVLSAQPGDAGPGPFPVWLAEAPDWLQHGIAYAGLGLVTLRATAAGRWRGVGCAALAAAWLIATTYGALDEFHQSFVPGRTPDIRDLTADGVGAALALGAAWAWSIISSRS